VLDHVIHWSIISRRSSPLPTGRRSRAWSGRRGSRAQRRRVVAGRPGFAVRGAVVCCRTREARDAVDLMRNAWTAVTPAAAS
jgi:hypothetical protein